MPSLRNKINFQKFTWNWNADIEYNCEYAQLILMLLTTLFKGDFKWYLMLNLAYWYFTKGISEFKESSRFKYAFIFIIHISIITFNVSGYLNFSVFVTISKAFVYWLYSFKILNSLKLAKKLIKILEFSDNWYSNLRPCSSYILSLLLIYKSAIIKFSQSPNPNDFNNDIVLEVDLKWQE